MTVIGEKSSSDKPNQDHLREFVADHTRELSELALQAGLPQASALLILAASNLHPNLSVSDAESADS